MSPRSGILNGKRTPRGIGITRAVACQMQAIWNPNMHGQGNWAADVPNPPRRRLRLRQALIVKYFDAGDPAGIFYLVGVQLTRMKASDVGYPIVGVSGSETRRQKRLKQINLPITGAVRVFSGQLAVEFGSTLEYG